MQVEALPRMLALSRTGRLVPLYWRAKLRQVVPDAASLLAVLFSVRGLGLGIPYLSPRLQAWLVAAPASATHPRSVHYRH
ncbi:hypothetical protein K3G63_21735 [Hymenobacter sp. HSC-4F20]|uniref:hypothetical protein n=1 Tax=Hymenobacter sp. HSC-4F20 TaxID=2864135 RepID=UPI001C72ECC2|nr:hypothetical protein [Hymenobacter sp. HSC-4F20]MBX0293081.1 hypothetical protein [Hymenobacter sp. HSC-4F20]